MPPPRHDLPVSRYQSRHLVNRFEMTNPDPDRHQNLTICSVAHCQPSLKISCKFVWKFLRKVANRQTNRQTNHDENITSLTEVNIVSVLKTVQWPIRGGLLPVASTHK